MFSINLNDYIMKIQTIFADYTVAQQVDAPEPATMNFSALQHHIGRPGDL